MNFINVNGHKLHYRFDGAEDLPVLVLSHSLGTDLSMWDLQMPEFTKHFRVLRYDMRGHGASEAAPGPYTIEQLALDVVGLLDGLEIERAHFCGISIGGMIGIWLAGHVPERLMKVALCNTAAYKGSPEAYDSRIATVLDGGMDAVVGGSLKTCFSASFHDKAPNELEKLRSMVLATSPEGYAACCAAIRDMDQREILCRISVPSLVIAGSEDVSMPPSGVQILAEQIPGSSYLELVAAHLSNIEAAEPFTAEIVKFMR
ncbi:3-oxoadipate enol-lactonase [Bacillus massiliigorillae]|uniref:3-oxoadipate enol-lactonase n=1 Tax=Bacillus massiliigorillae TaxID=1243664 RepID=UPI0003A39A8D|nr:3-oxoadipate enol-lactonase [Bacillus massiliigorillae]